jgi:Resolvase, N terminal domain
MIPDKPVSMIIIIFARTMRKELRLISTTRHERGCCVERLLEVMHGKFLLQQMAAVAELEAGFISARTKAALAVAREQGKQLGGYRLQTHQDRRKRT